MLGINPVGGAGEGYYLEAVAKGVDEYYRGVGEAPGWWAGSVTGPEFGLGGEVRSEDLRALWSGVDPATGEGLGRFTNREIGGFDLCWRAPKSVSLLFAFGSPEASSEVRDAHDSAVAAALGYLEANAAGTRTGRGGLQMEPVDGFVAAMFRHRTSRTGDPHLHTHVLVANLARGRDGRWRTLDGRLLYHHAKTAGYLYQAHLRDELTRRLGVAWQPVEKGSADLAGVDRAVIWAFSERRRQIVEHLDQAGFRSARAAQIATLATRPDKNNPTETTIRELWATKAAEVGFDPASVEDLVAMRSIWAVDDSRVRRLLRHLAGPEGLTRNASTFDRRDALQAVAAGLPRGAPVAEIEQIADVFLARNDVVALGESADFARLTRYSTTELIRLEQRLIADTIDRIDEHTGIVDPAWIDVAIGQRPSMGAEQAAMVRRLCGDGTGVAVVAAAAGTGKTYALDTAHDAWRNAGHQVIGAALAARAARELQTATAIPTCTLHKLTEDLQRGRIRLGPDTVVVIDEAGMVGTRGLAPILDAAQTAGAKVVLVGDPRQLPEIEAGGMLNALTQILDPVTLDNNRRQRHDWERRALTELRSGDVSTALDAYQTHGRLITAANATDVRQTMVDDWWDARCNHQDVIMLAIRHRDVDDLNARARRHLESAGLLHGPQLEIDERTYQAGDQIICLWNNYQLGVRNGDRGTIERVDPTQRTMLIRTPEGTRTLPAAYLDSGHVSHAYATTIHKAQGATVDISLVLGTDDLYRQAGYVALSRGRNTNTLYSVAAPEIDLDLTHAPTGRRQRPAAELVRGALHRTNNQQLAIETRPAATDRDAAERTRPAREIPPPTHPPIPDRGDDFGLGF